MPVQCPECARFLSNAFIAGLQKGPAPCPKCAVPLHASQFTEGAEGPAPDGDAPTAPDSSVRPPDLEPAQVRDAAPDPLAGWDQPSNVYPLHASGGTAGPVPPAGVAIGVGAAVGGLLGAVLSERSVRGALVGGSLGAAAGAAVTQAMARRHELDLIE